MSTFSIYAILDNMEKNNTISIGFVGVGTMASAIVKSLIRFSSKKMKIYLSPRNAERAQELSLMADYVEIMKSNQEVLDQSQLVVLAVTPQIAADVLADLKFRDDHHLISLISPISSDWIRNKLPSTVKLNKMVPLPFIQYGKGPILLYPEDKELISLLDELGHVVCVENEKQLDALITITALVSPFYRVLSETIKWGSENELSVEKSADYTVSFFDALIYMASKTKKEELLDLWQEMTPGGLNQKATDSLAKRAGFEMWSDALDIVLDFFTSGSLHD